jgi:hypothetical protein
MLGIWRFQSVLLYGLINKKMAEINLLQTNNDAQKKSPIWSGLMIGVGVLLLVLTAAAFFYLKFSNKNLVKNIEAEDKNQQQLQSEIRNDKNYALLLDAQQRVGVMSVLLDHHVDWSTLIPYFTDATYKDITYKSFRSKSDNFKPGGGAEARITGEANSFRDLDKMIKGLQLKDFSNVIREVKLISATPNSENATKAVFFDIRITFNNSILHAAN